MTAPENTRAKRDLTIDIVWLCLLIITTSIWCITAGDKLSATFDEPTYIDCGLQHWNTGSYKPMMRLGTMPLAIDVQTFPLYLYQKCHAGFDLQRDMDLALRISRLGSLLFWCLLLVYVFRIAHSLGGSWAGRIATALIAFEPCLLGHTLLATSDVAVTGMLAAFAYEFWKGREAGWLRRVVVPVVLYGLAIAVKASALVFAPMFMIVIESDRLWRTKEYADIPAAEWKARVKFLWMGLWQFRGEFFRIIGLGLLVVFLYVRSDWTTEPTFVIWAKQLPAGKLHDVMLWVSEHLRIFTNAGEGIVQQIKHNIRGNGSFILGRQYKRAVWFYFPLALTMKCSIPFLLLPLMIALVRVRALCNWPCLCALVLLLYSVDCHVQIGIRFMFPLMAMAAAGYGAAIVEACRENKIRWKRSVLEIFTCAGLAYTLLSAITVWPEGICYTNELWGGTLNGCFLLSDSNYDWGQGLKELSQWQEAHGIEAVCLCYFGLDPSSNTKSLRNLSLLDPPGKSWEAFFEGKCVAVSTTILYGTDTIPNRVAATTFLKQRPPTDRTTTYFIYDFRKGRDESADATSSPTR